MSEGQHKKCQCGRQMSKKMKICSDCWRSPEELHKRLVDLTIKHVVGGLDRVVTEVVRQDPRRSRRETEDLVLIAAAGLLGAMLKKDSCARAAEEIARG